MCVCVAICRKDSLKDRICGELRGEGGGESGARGARGVGGGESGASGARGEGGWLEREIEDLFCVRSGGGQEDGPPLGLPAFALVALACDRLLSAGGEIALFSPGPPQQLWWLLGDGIYTLSSVTGEHLICVNWPHPASLAELSARPVIRALLPFYKEMSWRSFGNGTGHLLWLLFRLRSGPLILTATWTPWWPVVPEWSTFSRGMGGNQYINYVMTSTNTS